MGHVFKECLKMRNIFSYTAGKGLSGQDFAEFEKKSESLFKNYHMNKIILHNSLKELSDNMTIDQFRFIRDNFLYRTFTTRDCVEKVLLSSQKNQDKSGIELAGLNLFQEDGENVPDKSHKKLMVQAWNAYGTFIMGEDAVDNNEHSIEEGLKSSKYLLDEVKRYRVIQNNLYGSHDHITVIATSYAQESVAEDMLEMFYETLFLAKEREFEKKGADFSAVTEYFSVHLDGTEQEHAQNARTVLKNNCKTQQDAQKAIMAIQTFLNAQSHIWNALDQKLKNIAPSPPMANVVPDNS